MDAKQIRKPSTQQSVGIIGLILSIVGLSAGAWFYRNNTRSRTEQARRQARRQAGRVQGKLQRQGQSSGVQTGMVIGAIGAGLAGALFGGSRVYQNRQLSGKSHSRDVRLQASVTIDRPPEEVYKFWRDFSNLPKVMSFIERVEPQEGNVYHWVAGGPAGPTIEWDAEVVDDQPGRLLAWRTLEGSDMESWGTVMFRRRDEGTRTHLSVAFNFCPSSSKAGAVAKYLASLENAVLEQNLRQLKAEMESGEIPTVHTQDRKMAAPASKGLQ